MSGARDFEEHLSDTPTCVLAFASGASRFEWGPTLAKIGVSHVLFRDTTERWYQEGIKGIGDAHDFYNYLQGVTNKYRTIGLGLSSGSYAALFFGMHARFNEVIAISPITGKGHNVTLRRDFEQKWWTRIDMNPDDPIIRDLSDLYSMRRTLGMRIPNIKAFVSDGDGAELDRQMAERIGITPTFIPGHSHAGLAKHMRDSGLLADIIGGKR